MHQAMSSPDAFSALRGAGYKVGITPGPGGPGDEQVSQPIISAAYKKSAAEAGGRISVTGQEIAPGAGIIGGGASGLPGGQGAPGGAAQRPVVAPYDENDPRNAAALASVKDPAMRRAIQTAAQSQNVSLPALVGIGMTESGEYLGGAKTGDVPRGAAGEYGPFQVTPDTGKGMGYSEKMLGIPAINAQAGAQYLRQQIDQSGSLEGGVQGYNPHDAAYVAKWRGPYSKFGAGAASATPGVGVPPAVPAATAPAPAAPAAPPVAAPATTAAAAAPASVAPTFTTGPNGERVILGPSPAAIGAATAAAKAPIEANQHAYELDTSKFAPEAAEAAETARGGLINANKIGELAAKVPTGTGTEFLTSLGSWMARIGGKTGEKWAAGLTGIDPNDSQELAKYLLRGVTDIEQTTNPRGGVNILRTLAQTLPSLTTRPRALQDIVNLMKVGYETQFEGEQQAVANQTQQGRGFRQNPAGDYESIPQFYQRFNSQYSAPVVLGAASALSNRPQAEWSKGLSPAQQDDALRLAWRTNPSAVIGGHTAPPSAQQ